MIVQTSLVHTAQVRARKIAWDGREVVQHGLLSDYIALDLDAEWRECDRTQAVLAGAGEPVRILVEGGGFNLPSSLMERTGPVRMCLIGYVGESARIVTAKEAAPLVVVESGEMGGADPAPEQPDLWATLMEEVRKATEGAKTAAQSATRAEADLRAAAERGDFDGEDGKTPVRGVDYWTAEDRKPIEDATLAALTSAGKADVAAATATKGEASRVAAETARAKAEQARATAETGRVEAEATRAANESERTETFNANLTSWNSKVDAACKKATDTASKAAQDAKTATDAAIAKTEEATNAAVAKAQTATDNATTAANKAEAAVSKLPLPLGNTLKGEAESTMVSVHDAYPAPLITAKVMGQSNQQQEPAPSPENPQEITNLNKAELVITGRNICPDAELLGRVSYNSEIPTNKYGIQAKFPYVQTAETNGIGAVLNTIKGVTYSIAYLGKANTAAVGIAEYKSVDDVGDVSKVVSYAHVDSSKKISLTASIDGVMVFVLASQWSNGTTNLNTFAKEDMIISIGEPCGTYTPHQSKSTPIDLQGNELCSLPNGVRDEVVIDAEGNVSLIKRTKQYSWNCAQIIKGTGRNYAVDKVLDIGANYTGLVAERAINATNNSIGICYVNQKMIYVTVPESVTTKEQANQLYGGMKVIYQLAEPQTIPLGKVELPALPEATSNIWNNGNIPANVYIQYLKDVNIAYTDLENQIKQITAALSVMDTPTVIPEI